LLVHPTVEHREERDILQSSNNEIKKSEEKKLNFQFFVDKPTLEIKKITEMQN